jgi:RHS repeat-associated protein
MNQWYDYDALNRLSYVKEQQNGAAFTGEQHYGYDRWGNREIKAGDTYGAGIPEPQFELGETASKNRLLAPGDLTLAEGSRKMRYDAAGNLTYDSYTKADSGGRAYDAENRMTSAWGPSLYGGSYQNFYVYDAAGKRVRRKTETGEVWQVYGFDGELVAEYGVGASPAAPKKEYGYRGGELLVVGEGVAASPSPDAVWVEDALPAGAQTSAGGVNEAWNWVTAGPAPASGSKSHQTPVTAGLHQQYFQNATQTMQVAAGDSLVAYVYLDPANTPSEIMIQWHDNSAGWEHRAYWGANNIGWGADGTNSRRYMGTLPPAGQWVRLEVPAFTLYGGRATWDRAGKAAAGGPRWLVSDHLGTPRITADKTGSLAGIKRHDYLPFGEGIGAGVGGRTGGIGGQGYDRDSVRQQFTSKERDDETGLDYFGARYYALAQGRFTSPDEFQGGPQELFVLGSGHQLKQAIPYGDIFSPQSLNKYQYCLNNPLRYTDPDGHDYRIVEEKDKDGKMVRRYVWDRGYTYKKGDKNGAPSNARYIDTQGRAIQLWGDNQKDPRKEQDHGYQVVEPGPEGDDEEEDYRPGAGEPPSSYASTGDTVRALQNAGYKDIWDPFHGGRQFAQPNSPTLHVIIESEVRYVEGAPISATERATITRAFVTNTEFHRDDYSQANKDLGKHMCEAVRKWWNR